MHSGILGVYMKIYFSGIGGVGIGPLAEIASDAGYEVLGSDRQASLITDQLSARGIDVSIGQDGSFLEASHNKKPIDWFVYTSALPKDHPELVLASQLGIKVSKRDELLAHIINQKGLKLLAVAGTHGKTTTSAMLVWALQQLNVPLSWSVGSTLSFGPSGKFDSKSEYFVYECDEFDRNFLHFSPYLSLITSIDYDHFDTFPTRSDYHEAFRQFGKQSNQLITWQDQQVELFSGHPSSWILSEPLDVNLAGAHNRRNATLVLKALEKLGYTGNYRENLENFPGAARRFEKLANNLYSDYGHHPAEISATLQMARELNDKVVLVYQPHQNARQHEIKDQYKSQFELADTVYWLPTYLSRENPNQAVLDPEELTANLTNKPAVKIADLDNVLWQNIQAALNEGKLVLGMGAGSIDAWLREQLAK